MIYLSPSEEYFAIHVLYCPNKFSPYSSEATRSRAKVLADEIGSWHLDISIDGVVSSLLSLFQTLTGKRPRYKVKMKHNFFIILMIFPMPSTRNSRNEMNEPCNIC